MAGSWSVEAPLMFELYGSGHCSFQPGHEGCWSTCSILRTFYSRLSNKLFLEAAVEEAAEFLNKAVKPVMVGGPSIRVAKASEVYIEVADTFGYALAVKPAGTGIVPDHHPHFIGT